jgi:hypothetical protein
VVDNAIAITSYCTSTAADAAKVSTSCGGGATTCERAGIEATSSEKIKRTRDIEGFIDHFSTIFDGA